MAPHKEKRRASGEAKLIEGYKPEALVKRDVTFACCLEVGSNAKPVAIAKRWSHQRGAQASTL
jgi:hypothetical protein